ncbi:helix-turn-helix transcriptional regulator [Lagierella sp. ICN-221743]
MQQPYFKLKAYFVEKNIPFKDVAKLLGITEQNFSSKINRNGQDFTLPQVRKLCSEFKLDPNEFFLR